jgi:NCS1 family nucleobase:cation symporter-1
VTAPFLLLIGVALLAWAVVKAGGFGTMLAAPSKFQTFGEFFHFFVPSLTGVVGFWATVALNIPDFTRYARSQRSQMLGQALGLPATMTFYSFIGVAVTSATAIIFGQAIWDPVQVLARLGNPVAVVIAMLALLLATLNVNVAANLVSPSNDFSNLSPRLISFRTGGLITCVVGVAVFQPWKLLANYGNYIYIWLDGYSGFLGPIAGIMICDYFIVRKKILLVEDLYQRRRFYEFSSGFNLRAMAALAAGVGLAFIGLVVPSLRRLYDYAWFVGFAASFIVYWAIMRAPRDAESR